MGYSAEQLRYAINHVFLPPKLPQEYDQSGDKDNAIAALMAASFMQFQARSKQTHLHPRKMLDDFRDTHKHDHLVEKDVKKALNNLKSGTSGATITFFIRAQNAGIILRKIEDKLLVESFEAAPPAQDVLAASGKLLCSYPGPAIRLPSEPLGSNDFIRELTNFLVEMNNDGLMEDDRIRRTSLGVREDDTTDPQYITSLLMGIFRGLRGEPADVQRIKKRVADDVVAQGKHTPWRRSSVYLVLRVALQRALMRTDPTHNLYKSFMVYFHSYVIERVLESQRNFNSDTLFTVRAKMSRRLAKLVEAGEAQDFLMPHVQSVCDKVENILQSRWERIQASAVDPQCVGQDNVWDPQSVSIEIAAEAQLSNSENRIKLALDPTAAPPAAVSSFTPTQHTRLRELTSFVHLSPDVLQKAIATDCFVALADFEFLVGRGKLEEWVEARLTSPNRLKQEATQHLWQYLKSYHSSASTVYQNNPEDESLMVLTILELWVAIDKLALSEHPLMRKYPSGLPAESDKLVKPLLLRKAVDLERAKKVAEYMRERRKGVEWDVSVFSDQMDAFSFPVKYYESSIEMQNLREEIEDDATTAQKAVLAELSDQMRRYNDLKVRAKASHVPHTNDNALYGSRRKRVKYDCPGCDLDAQCANITCSTYEWPLPTEEEEIRRVVFELRVPKSFAFWRAATALVLFDMATPDEKKKEFEARKSVAMLSSRSKLENYCVPPGDEFLVTLASPMPSRHYSSTKSLPATREDVCLGTRFSWRWYDPRNKLWISQPPSTSGVTGNVFREANTRRFGTLTLPPKESSIYTKAKLQYAVSATGHTSNQVLANQADCPPELSMHEFIAFGTMRSGARIQWMNLLREMRSTGTALTWGRGEVGTLVSMVIWQVGALKKDELEWHLDLDDLDFGKGLLEEARGMLRRVEGNWKEVITVRTTVLIISRLLSSSPHDEVVDECVAFLRDARRVTWTWLGQLQQKLQSIQEEFVKGFQERVCEMAAVCRSTFDVDDVDWDGTGRGYLPELLSTSEDVKIFVCCGILVHDNAPHDLESAKSTVPLDFKRLLHRDRRLMHVAEPSLCEIIQEQGGEGLNQAIEQIWTGYNPGSVDWEVEGRWASCTTAGVASAQQVHLDLLRGRLLVNGKPLGRLPVEVVTHSDYMRIFGDQQVLDVIPAQQRGMDFATRSLFYGHQVFFGMREEKDVVIRATHSGKTYELIPHTFFRGDLPLRLVEECAHWLELSSGDIEIRPLQSLWTPSDDNWKIHFKRDRRVCMNRDRILIDINSTSFGMVAATLEPFEHRDYLMITCRDFDPSTLVVELPRFRLSFYRNASDELESRNFPGMVIDHTDQSVGALVGLQTRLVLTPACPRSAALKRKVLVPYGTVEIPTYLDDHVKVQIKTGNARTCRFADYTIDSEQGCLTGNAGLKSKLYLVYLLALTSHCLPDPLTQHTGTEEALTEFYSAACLSFRELSEDETALLVQIGKLTPTRASSSGGRQLTVTWSTLPPLSQHEAFVRRAKEILAFAKNQRVFDDALSKSANPSEVSKRKEKEKEKSSSLPNRNALLDARAASRTCMYYTTDFPNGPSVHSVSDQEYSARDCQLPREGMIAAVATNIYLGTASDLLPRPAPLPDLFLKEWRQIREPVDNFSLSYGGRWLYTDMANSWLSIYSQCTSRTEGRQKKKYQLLFSLSAMVFNNPKLASHVPSITLCVTEAGLANEVPPHALDGSFDLSYGQRPSQDRITKCVNESLMPIQNTPSWALERNEEEENDDRAFRKRRDRHHQTQVQHHTLQLRDHFLTRWQPWMNGNTAVQFPSHVDNSYFSSDVLIRKIRHLFRVCNENRLLLQHARAVNNVFENGFDVAIEQEVSEYNFERSRDPRTPTKVGTSISSLLKERDPFEMSQHGADLWGNVDAYRSTDASAASPKLNSLLQHMSNSNLALRKLYAQDLQESVRNMNTISSPPSADSIPFTEEELMNEKELCMARYEASLNRIAEALAPISSLDKAIAGSGMWPRLTMRDMLRQLAYPFHCDLRPDWINALLLLARDFIEFQRAVRLLSYIQQGKKEDFFREIDTHVFDMEKALQYPDWVLVQIEGNFLARPLQVRVAQEMIQPSSAQNTVLQLNMGEGKSSVIVPLVATALADGNKLVRVIVLKPLAGQMFQLLVDRLAGLANRRIFYMPFSRNIRVGAGEIKLIQQSYMSCMRQGGLWIVQPEHILSFKLMGIDRCLVSSTPEETAVAQALMESQRWLDLHSRDILDESDEILHNRYQLLYTVGQQHPLELHPHRWTVVQELYTFVSKHIAAVKERNRNGVDLQSGPSGSFLPVRIIESTKKQSKPERELIDEVVNDIFSGKLSSFNVHLLPVAIQQLAREFVTSDKPEDEHIQQLMQHCGDKWKHLLLLRGLIAHGVLAHSLKNKQYRVDYGLDLSRSLLAVPYRAKDVPSIRAEFGHPDVAVTLTCLTYYYQGLDERQLGLCLDLLYKLDNPPLVYKTWVNGDPDIPSHLQNLNGLNTEDADQHKTLVVPLFSKRKTVIDFYLSHFVFPKAAKGFPHKLSTSGWDLAESKPGHLTTGFSGTNDNRFLLPTSISQQDPLQQSGTNAKVLTYLLQKENNEYRHAALPDGGRLPVRAFLEYMIQQTEENPVQVLLDVGAQMLDLKNDDLAKQWLLLREDMAAAIFFNDNDEMTVVTQDGIEEPLISSPFKGQLDRCLVYLDDAHTRGTDLKLPSNSRAAVTLGPKVPKDRLMQGCMRMRKLGFGQSVIFFAPTEIDRAIRDSRPAKSKGGVRRAVPLDKPVKTEDILRWAMLETCKDIMHHLPQWAEQGWDYQRRRQAWDTFGQEVAAAQASEDEQITPNTDILNRVWVRDETLSLERMYGVKTYTGVGGADADMREAIFAIPELRERLVSLGAKEVQDLNVDEENEREVSHEIEKETEIERPPKVAPAEHRVSPLVEHFVKTGVLHGEGHGQDFRGAFMGMFHSLYPSVKSLPLDQEIWSKKLLVTTDFALTISEQDDNERGRAEYLRPVNWIVTSSKDPNLVVVLSPFEVNKLLPTIRKHSQVSLHMYAPRVSKDMRPTDDLQLYTVPQLSDHWRPPPNNIISQLNLYAGQLYFGSYDMYTQLCQFLGLYTGKVEPMVTDPESHPIEGDGFVRTGDHRIPMGLSECLFTESPVPFLSSLIGLRRKGTGYLPTHMGQVLMARLLKEEDFNDTERPEEDR